MIAAFHQTGLRNKKLFSVFWKFCLSVFSGGGLGYQIYLALSCHSPRVCLSDSAMGDSGPPSCTSWLRRHPVLWWILPAYSGNESQVTQMRVIFVWPVYAVPVMTDWHFFLSVTHSIAFSPFSQFSCSGFLTPWRNKHLTVSLILQLYQFLSVFPLLWRICGKVLQSRIIMVKVVGHGLVDKVESSRLMAAS